MLKLAGAGFIMIGSLGLGNYLCKGIKKNYQELLDFRETLAMLGNEIRILKVPVSEALQKVADQIQTVYSPVLKGIAERLQEYCEPNPCSVWKQEFMEKKQMFHLTKEELKVVISAGELLLHDEYEMQGEKVRLIQERISTQIAMLEEDMKKKQKVYRYLSCAGGIYLILLMI